MHARDDAKQAVRLCPDNVKAAYRLGLAEKELGEIDKDQIAREAKLMFYSAEGMN